MHLVVVSAVLLLFTAYSAAQVNVIDFTDDTSSNETEELTTTTDAATTYKTLPPWKPTGPADNRR